MIAEVFINLPVKKIAAAFTYRIPKELAQIGAGWRVVVPFGGRTVEGFVIRTDDDGTAKPEIPLKNIISAVDDEPWFSPKLLKAAQWLSEYYLCSPAEALRLFMPGKSGVKISAGEIKKREKALYEKIVSLAQDAPPSFAVKTAALIKEKSQPPSETDGAAKPAERKSDAPKSARLGNKQLALIEALKNAGGEMTQPQLKSLGFSPATIASLVVRRLVSVREERILRDSYKIDAQSRLAQNAPPLTDEQAVALAALDAPLKDGQYHPFLLYGITGSGKTRIYIEAAAQARAVGRQVIVLVPEIALTGQLVAAFQAYFAGDIAVMHSRLSLEERSDAVRRVREQNTGIIIGARSALFTPVKNLGLIILDEEQDLSYKQDEAPRYHARVVAECLARIFGSVLIFGSATPSLETAYRAAHGEIKLLKLTRRIGNRPLPEAVAVDMREELKRGNRQVISRPLTQLIEDTLDDHGQMVLLLNRRGYSTFVMCRSCGYVAKCPDCGLPLVYHQNGRLVCHHCDISAAAPQICPTCQSKYIRYFGTGTEKLEAELNALAPAARVVRMDRDTTGGKFSHQEILGAFRRGEYDILLGTQMVAKGHDIPSVTAVGIVSADSALNLPDFRAAERTFMLITQTAGRAGRGDKAGRVLVQGYNPTHYAVAAALKQDYAAFYRAEIKLRKELFYPPFCTLIKLTFVSKIEAKAQAKAAEIVGRFRAKFGTFNSAAENILKNKNICLSQTPPETRFTSFDPLERGARRREEKSNAERQNIDGRGISTGILNSGLKNQIIGPAPALVACLRGVYRYIALIKTAELPRVRAFLREEGLNTDDGVLIDIDPINTV